MAIEQTGPVAPLAAGRKREGWMLSESSLTLWTAAGGVVGLAGFIWVLGGVIFSIRLHHMKLPVEWATSVAPREYLIALAVDVLIGPMIVTSILMFFSTWNVRRSVDLTVAAVESIDENAALESARWVTALLQVLKRMWAARFGVLAILGVAYFLVVPSSSWLFWVPIAGVQVPVMHRLGARARSGEISRRRELVLLCVTAAATSGVVTLVTEAVNPQPLPLVAVTAVGQQAGITGVFVAQTDAGVYVGVRQRLVMVPADKVQRVVVRNSPPQKLRQGRTWAQVMGF